MAVLLVDFFPPHAVHVSSGVSVLGEFFWLLLMDVSSKVRTNLRLSRPEPGAQDLRNSMSEVYLSTPVCSVDMKGNYACSPTEGSIPMSFTVC